MKTLLKNTFALLVLLSNLITAQGGQGINYKALIKDNAGNVLANQNMTVQFTVLKGTAQTQIYQESQTTTTDANGIIVVTIGEGVPLGDAILNNDDYFLNVQIDTGNGLVDMGTSQFRTVPYAINAIQANYAQNAASANNVTGLEKITENNKTGWRLVGQDPANYGNIGRNAVDLSSGASNSLGATGNFSAVMGTETTASGLHSTAMGYGTIASGEKSIAMGYRTLASKNASTAMGYKTYASGIVSTTTGYKTTASGSYSTAMGFTTLASKNYATAMGTETKALGNFSTAMGRRTIASGAVATTFGSYTEAKGVNSFAIGYYNFDTNAGEIFMIGNGTGNLRSNAFTIFKNGDAFLSGSLSQNSDKRLKTDIKDLKYGLNEVLKLHPVSYYWKKYPNQKNKSIGLIAQEVQPILKELVHTAKDKDKTLSLSYTELIPVLINAIQEQQQIILKQQTQLNTQNNNYMALLKRIVSLEKSNYKNYTKRFVSTK